MHCLAAALALLRLPAAAEGADTGAARRRRWATAPLRLSFAARPGVCGNGGHNITIVERRRATASGRATARPGPVRVSLRVRGGRVHRRAHLRRRAVAAARGHDDRPRHRAGRARRRPTCSRWPSEQRADAEELVTARHPGGQRGRLAGPAPDGPPRPTCRSRRGGRRCSGWARRRARRPRAGSIRSPTDERRRARGAEAGGVRPVAAAGGRGRAGADPDRPHESAPPSCARRRSSGWARARIRGRSRCSRRSCGRPWSS